MDELLSTIQCLLDGLAGQSVLIVDDAFDDDGLIELLGSALRLAQKRDAFLSGIEIDLVRHPQFADTFWHVPIGSSPTRDLIKLRFETAQVSA